MVALRLGLPLHPHVGQQRWRSSLSVVVIRCYKMLLYFAGSVLAAVGNRIFPTAAFIWVYVDLLFMAQSCSLPGSR